MYIDIHCHITCWLSMMEGPTIVDAPLTLIFQLGQTARRVHFYQWKQPILWLCLTIARLFFKYLIFITEYCWHFVDTHFQHGAGRKSLSLLPPKAAYISFMNVCKHLPLRLPKMQNQKLLTLHWFTFAGLGREHVSLVVDYNGGHYIKIRQRHTTSNILWFTEGYLTATINQITRRLGAEIGTNRSSHAWQNLLVTSYGYLVGPTQNIGSRC